MPTARINGAQVQLDYVPRDGYGLVAHGLASLVRIAQSPDHRQAKEAMQAAMYLVEFGERLLAEKAARQPEPVKAFQQTRSDLLNDLKGLYAKALGPAPLVVEAESAESIPVKSERS
ncbi:MAG TPA: hypothetical protein VNW90_19105 [Acetobacteraceae bacterium]|jgi:hypothetical protein|nr:hypothetical protein [Acetobacteraceae bacterium]